MIELVTKMEKKRDLFYAKEVDIIKVNNQSGYLRKLKTSSSIAPTRGRLSQIGPFH